MFGMSNDPTARGNIEMTHDGYDHLRESADAAIVDEITMALARESAVVDVREALIASHDRLGHDGIGCGCLDALDALD